MQSRFYHRLSRALEAALIVLMVVGIIVTVTLPFSITAITGRHPGEELGLYEKYLVLLAVSGVFAELILWQVRGIVHNVNAGRPFCADTPRRLKVCGIECFILSMLYFAAMFVITKFFTAIAAIVFLVAAAILLVLTDLFRQAEGYKEENDMTI